MTVVEHVLHQILVVTVMRDFIPMDHIVKVSKKLLIPFLIRLDMTLTLHCIEVVFLYEQNLFFFIKVNFVAIKENKNVKYGLVCLAFYAKYFTMCNSEG